MHTNNRHNQLLVTVTAVGGLLLIGANGGCDGEATQPISSSEVRKPPAAVQLGPVGTGTDERAERSKTLNQPDVIQHLYVISPYTGQVLIYSTVKGHVGSIGSDRFWPPVSTGMIPMASTTSSTCRMGSSTSQVSLFRSRTG